ncbi:hypothetical protein IFM89_019032 [Coptis chinensis]|uniref:Pyruvate kinase barrel domain-containing protein n=1 Tax=Coptis chinensis TaxID=261450 RepID=A0A835LJU5_9MAGN|nr:hypothetical protein IFM89_019032 [Coptis chinensis]
MSFKNRKKSKLARAVWMGKDFSSTLPHQETPQSQFDLNRSLAIIKELKTALPSNFVWDEVGIIVDFISNDHDYSYIEDLYNYIELLFVNMLYTFLPQLPHALYKEVSESPAEDFNDRVRRSLGILYKIESLDDQIHWSFPTGPHPWQLQAGACTSTLCPAVNTHQSIKITVASQNNALGRSSGREVENQEGVANCDDIIANSDAFMVARGDLANSVGVALILVLTRGGSTTKMVANDEAPARHSLIVREKGFCKVGDSVVALHRVGAASVIKMLTVAWPWNKERGSREQKTPARGKWVHDDRMPKEAIGEKGDDVVAENLQNTSHVQPRNG